MQVRLVLPDDIAHCLESKWGDLERKLLERRARRHLVSRATRGCIVDH